MDELKQIVKMFNLEETEAVNGDTMYMNEAHEYGLNYKPYPPIEDKLQYKNEYVVDSKIIAMIKEQAKINKKTMDQVRIKIGNNQYSPVHLIDLFTKLHTKFSISDLRCFGDLNNNVDAPVKIVFSIGKTTFYLYMARMLSVGEEISEGLCYTGKDDLIIELKSFKVKKLLNYKVK